MVLCSGGDHLTFEIVNCDVCMALVNWIEADFIQIGSCFLQYWCISVTE